MIFTRCIKNVIQVGDPSATDVAPASWTAAVLCRFSSTAIGTSVQRSTSLAKKKRHGTAAVQDLAESLCASITARHSSFTFAVILIFAVFIAFPATAETTNALPAPPIKEVQPGIFEIGKVRLNKNERSISFPAAINMTNGPVEYLLVSAVGKLHESVLKTDVNPMHIHLAALLLGAKGVQTHLTVRDFDTKEIPGETIHLFVQWPAKSGDKKVRAEQLVFNTETKKVMTTGPWVYNGSQVHGGTYVAQRDGLIVSIMSDPLAVMNNPRPGREDDEIWRANNSPALPLNTPVQFIIQFKETEK